MLHDKTGLFHWHCTCHLHTISEASQAVLWISIVDVILHSQHKYDKLVLKKLFKIMQDKKNNCPLHIALRFAPNSWLPQLTGGAIKQISLYVHESERIYIILHFVSYMCILGVFLHKCF